MLKSIFPVLLSLVAFSANAEAAECESGWMAYKDEQCFKLFTNLVTYAEANDFCSSQGSEVLKASMVIVQEEDMQDILGNYTHDIYDYVWLGGRYDKTTSQFKWEDGSIVTYTNWQEGYPRNITDSDSCIEMRPSNARFSANSNGQWANVVCQKRNLVMCQKTLSWTLQDAVNEVIRIRKDLVTTQEKLQTTEENLQAVSTKVVPVGSVYIEYKNQPSPVDLWPNLTWEDISSSYAGLFFRASGGGSASWGTTQEECAPRISQMNIVHGLQYSAVPNPLIIPKSSGWTGNVQAGIHSTSTTHTYEGFRFYVESCEVRPRNQAIRIWKRIA